MDRPTPTPGKATHRHPVNRKLFDEATVGEQIADRVTGFLGSWRFIIIQSVIVRIWIVGNVYLLTSTRTRSSSSISPSRPRRPTRHH